MEFLFLFEKVLTCRVALLLDSLFSCQVFFCHPFVCKLYFISLQSVCKWDIGVVKCFQLLFSLQTWMGALVVVNAALHLQFSGFEFMRPSETKNRKNEHQFWRQGWWQSQINLTNHSYQEMNHQSLPYQYEFLPVNLMTHHFRWVQVPYCN